MGDPGSTGKGLTGSRDHSKRGKGVAFALP